MHSITSQSDAASGTDAIATTATLDNLEELETWVACSFCQRPVRREKSVR